MRAFIEYIIETLKGSSLMTAFDDDMGGGGAALCDFEPGAAKPQKGPALPCGLCLTFHICSNSDLDENVASESMGFGRYALLSAPTSLTFIKLEAKSSNPGISSSSS
ncbi:hypothetical protein GOA68_03100 [Sinorhizobium meliloti]|nr:hypothetical protein [Sinorhizobium meliloti]MDW9987575.1 hypothetical protein [Sinorhizobium meliloti]MDX0241547.1 hypothetical protein [Sinorhizobium meliloti]MDX0397840.1 hypothetical protein [Sinorhizobium meliloti]